MSLLHRRFIRKRRRRAIRRLENEMAAKHVSAHDRKIIWDALRDLPARPLHTDPA